MKNKRAIVLAAGGLGLAGLCALFSFSTRGRSAPIATVEGSAAPASSGVVTPPGARDEEATTETTTPHGGGFARPAPRVPGKDGFRAAARDEDKGDLPFARNQAPSPGVRAGEWDDNANYREFQRFLASQEQLAKFTPVDVRARRFLVVRDADGKPMPRCKVTVHDAQQHETSFVTTASGRAVFFPYAEGFARGGQRGAFTATARCAEGAQSASFALTDDDDGVVDLKLAEKRAPITTRPVDVAFVLDTTGSMNEEIAAVKTTIQKVAKSLGTSEIKVRVGLVEYKDRGDDFVTKVYPMTSDLGSFQGKIAGIFAGGGGDIPEHMTAGLHDALVKLDWSKDAVARMAFVIGDAPTHLDYDDQLDYVTEMKNAAHRGVQLFTVAASGMDTGGQIVWRQMAQYTGGSEMFVLRGGAGPSSVGGGDPVASCGGTQQQYASGNLDELITGKIKRELKAIDGDPMRIPGLKTDENAKPCNERIALF